MCVAHPTKPKTFPAAQRAATSVPAPPRARVNLLSATARRATTLVPRVVVAQYIAVAAKQPSDDTRRAPHGPRVCIVSPPPEQARSPERVCSGRCVSIQGPSVRAGNLPARTAHATQTSFGSSALSFVLCVLGTIRSHAHGLSTALQRTPRSSRSVLLRPHSRSAAFEPPVRHRTGTGYHPGSRRTSRVSISRCSFGHVGRGCYPTRVLNCRTPRLPPGCGLHRTHRDACDDFRGQEREAPPYPPTATLSRFGIVSE